MKEHKLIVLGLLVVLLSIPATTNAVFFQSFGGRITKANKALQIETIEDSGYVCNWFTGSIDINPVKGSRSYLTTAINSTRTSPSIGQQILGLYSFVPQLVTCESEEPPYIRTVFMSRVEMPWGTSLY